MIDDILYRIRLSKHYWRSVPFAEMAELYTSRFLRTVSQGMFGVFIVVFLYQKGYSVTNILLLVGGYYALRIFLCIGAAYYVAWAGPKRATLISNLLIVPSLWALVVIDQYTLLSVIVYFVMQALSLSLYYVASDIQFSTIRHTGSSGKEMGWLQIMEKVGAGAAPAIGGLVAFLFGPERVMLIAAVLSIASALPLFLSPEKVRRKQKITIHGLPIALLRKQFVSSMASGFDYVVSTATWALFVAVVVFGTGDNSVYAKLGLVFSISLITSIISSHIYGVLIDKRRAPELFQVGVIINSLIHVVRPFVNNPVGVGATNAANEVGTSAYNMPYMQSVYEVADELAGYRAIYIALILSAFCVGAALLAFASAGLVWWLGVADGMKWSFIITAAVTLTMLRHGFPSLRRTP